MKYCRHIIVAFLLALSCLYSSGEERVTLRPIRPSRSKNVPYSTGVFVHGARISSLYTYETSTGDLLEDGFEFGGGCYTRLYFYRNNNPTLTVRCHAQAEIGYRYRRFSDMDNLQDKMAHIDCHYISPAVTLGVSFMSAAGMTLGFGCDLLAGFRGAQQSMLFRTVNKECMNKVIPKVIFGCDFFDSLISCQIEFPLNSGEINLDRYTYYNRRSISYNLPGIFRFRIQIRTFGSSHR